MASSPHAHTNALARETSPYLLQHAHNPVDWHPWGPQAFDLARQRETPIFLSIGYSTCYWCHVMERQCFENPVIAEHMNRDFVCVKVDREERPDVDDLYMTATQLMTRRGGWPMSVFLTPHERWPFWCGTYLPPEPAHGMPSFLQVLRGVSQAWRERRQAVLDQAAAIAQAVREVLDRRDLAGPLALDLVSAAAEQLLRSYDAEHGGFGGAPKFPQPSCLLLLLAVHRNNPEAGVGPPLAHTLDRMARGGIHDQIGGGFHRYSTDARWIVPHFEKMLYDQGQLLETYAQASALGLPSEDASLYGHVVRRTAEYLLREMTDPQGGFWSAQDAEVDAREGDNYVWTAEQIREAIRDPVLEQTALAYYGLDAGPNFRDPHHADAAPVNVLHVPVACPTFAASRGISCEDLCTQLREMDRRLLAVRNRRKQPATDDKVIAGWNGLAIAGLAAAGQALAEPRFTEAAIRAATFIWNHLRQADGSLWRTWRAGVSGHQAVLEDYALLAHGLLAVHRASGDQTFLQKALAVVESAIDRFAAASGGYYDTRADSSDLFVRSRSLHDGAIPSGSSVMAHNLIDLYELTGDRVWLDRAVRDLRSVGQAMREQGAAMAHLHHALLRAAQHDPSILQTAPRSREDGVVRAEYQPPHLVLDIAPGHHLTAESLSITGQDCSLDVKLPPPAIKRYPHADRPLEVYEGRVRVHVEIRQTSGSQPTLRLRYQACTDAACLPPVTLDIALESAASP